MYGEFLYHNLVLGTHAHWPTKCAKYNKSTTESTYSNYGAIWSVVAVHFSGRLPVRHTYLHTTHTSILYNLYLHTTYASRLYTRHISMLFHVQYLIKF